MRRIINDISNGKNLAENLKKYLSEMKKLNYKYAYVRLAMNYYTYFQMLLDDESKREGHRTMAEQINRVIRDAVLSDDLDINEAIDVLDKNREILMGEVSALTYYVDVFRIYEHALNRVEYRFKNEQLPKEYNDEAFCRSLMQYIVADEDSVVINSKISEIIAELPIRMTKVKFYEHISNGLSIYKGTEKKTLEDFLYMIRTSSMLGECEDYREKFPELEDTLSAFKQADYGHIDKNEYEMLIRSVEDVSVYIEDVMNISMMLMEIMNDAYSILLTKDEAEYSKEIDKQIEACCEIVSSVNDFFILGSEIDEETEDMFVILEGCQEILYSKLSTYNILDEIASAYESEIQDMGLAEEYKRLAKLEILASDSLFVELDKQYEDVIVDDEILEKEKNKLIEEFGDLFSKNGKNINRAVMSTVLAQLPVFFNNISELQDYIYNALNNCGDLAEKLACVEVLHQIMED